MSPFFFELTQLIHTLDTKVNLQTCQVSSGKSPRTPFLPCLCKVCFYSCLIPAWFQVLYCVVLTLSGPMTLVFESDLSDAQTSALSCQHWLGSWFPMLLEENFSCLLLAHKKQMGQDPPNHPNSFPPGLGGD